METKLIKIEGSEDIFKLETKLLDFKGVFWQHQGIDPVSPSFLRVEVIGPKDYINFLKLNGSEATDFIEGYRGVASVSPKDLWGHEVIAYYKGKNLIAVARKITYPYYQV